MTLQQRIQRRFDVLQIFDNGSHVVGFQVGFAVYGKQRRLGIGQRLVRWFAHIRQITAGNGGLQVINGYNVANGFKKVYQNQSDMAILNQKDMQDLLVKDGYAKMDLSCLPITDKSR